MIFIQLKFGLVSLPRHMNLMAVIVLISQLIFYTWHAVTVKMLQQIRNEHEKRKSNSPQKVEAEVGNALYFKCTNFPKYFRGINCYGINYFAVEGLIPSGKFINVAMLQGNFCGCNSNYVSSTWKNSLCLLNPLTSWHTTYVENL